MNINAGDYVTLKSIEEVKHLYKFWNVEDYFTAEMLFAMNTSNMYTVIEASPDGVWVDIKGKMWVFDEKCIKDVYRLTKVN